MCEKRLDQGLAQRRASCSLGTAGRAQAGPHLDSVTDPLFKTRSCDSKAQATASTVQEESVIFLKVFIISLGK